MPSPGPASHFLVGYDDRRLSVDDLTEFDTVKLRIQHILVVVVLVPGPEYQSGSACLVASACGLYVRFHDEIFRRRGVLIYHFGARSSVRALVASSTRCCPAAGFYLPAILFRPFKKLIQIKVLFRQRKLAYTVFGHIQAVDARQNIDNVFGVIHRIPYLHPYSRRHHQRQVLIQNGVHQSLFHVSPRRGKVPVVDKAVTREVASDKFSPAHRVEFVRYRLHGIHGEVQPVLVVQNGKALAQRVQVTRVYETIACNVSPGNKVYGIEHVLHHVQVSLFEPTVTVDVPACLHLADVIVAVGIKNGFFRVQDPVAVYVQYGQIVHVHHVVHVYVTFLQEHVCGYHALYDLSVRNGILIIAVNVILCRNGVGQRIFLDVHGHRAGADVLHDELYFVLFPVTVELQLHVGF